MLSRRRPDFDACLAQQLPGLSAIAGMMVAATGVVNTSGAVSPKAASGSGGASSPPVPPAVAWQALREGLAQLRADTAFAVREATAEVAVAVEAASEALGELARYFGVQGQGARPDNAKDPRGLAVMSQLAELLAGFARACAEVRAAPPIVSTDTASKRAPLGIGSELLAT